MKVLLLHPDDNFESLQARSDCDLIVDLGRAPESFYDEWRHRVGCEIFSIFDLAIEVEDLLAWRDLLRVGLGYAVDQFGVDWWDVIGLLLQPQMQELRLAQRLADKIVACKRLTASRPSPVGNALRLRLGCAFEVTAAGVGGRLTRGVRRYGRAAANLGFGQLRQVIYDKYDAQYFWRRRFTSPARRSSEPVVLLPSAYSNVTRAAFRFADVLPERRFLLVLARESGGISPVPGNVQVETLAAFAGTRPDAGELRELESDWQRLENSLRTHPEFELIARLGVFDVGKRWLRWCLAVRNAWNSVFEHRTVVSCLSADDSNPYTRIPLILARQRQLPAVACHHGALDGMMAFKRPAFSTYLVKGEMERDYMARVCGMDSALLQIGGARDPRQDRLLWSDLAPWIVFFTEPYEADLWRTGPIYRDVIPRLCAAARQAGKRVVVKLHPFESLRQRRRMLDRTLNPEDRKLVNIIAAPLSREMLAKTWCAVTVESTTAFECATVGIPAFLCGWLRHAYVGYARQYSRFGVAQMIDHADDLLSLPRMVKAAIPPADLRDRLMSPIAPGRLSELLCNSQPVTLR